MKWVSDWLERLTQAHMRKELLRRRPEYLRRLEQINAAARARMVAGSSAYRGLLPDSYLQEQMDQWDANCAKLMEQEVARYDARMEATP